MVQNSDDVQSTGCFGGFKLWRFFRGEKRRVAPRVFESQFVSDADTRHEKLDRQRYSSHSSDFDFGFGMPSEWGRPAKQPPSDSFLPPYIASETNVQRNSAAERTINSILDKLDPELNELSMKIHEHPEIAFQERYARDTLTDFMRHHGFKVTSGYLGLETAWKAEYTYGTGGKVIGINSEMDALSRIGHACGHNLIAASGCGVAIALKVALETHEISGKIILLGTPAEENGGGKIILLERGGYDEMDFCIMSHPGPLPLCSFDLGATTAVQTFEVEYTGKGAHAGAAPWEGVNALDAAFLAYSSLSVLRQQMKPTHRSHGIVQGRDWISNVIPDNATLRWQIRAPTSEELSVLAERVRKCFEAAALATGCTVKVSEESPYYDLANNPVLAGIFSEIVQTHFGHPVSAEGSAASTDFGNVSHYLPALHPLYSIPTQPGGGNHTPAFTKASATKEAHAANMITTRSLALTALRVIQSDELYRGMKASLASRSAQCGSL